MSRVGTALATTGVMLALAACGGGSASAPSDSPNGSDPGGESGAVVVSALQDPSDGRFPDPLIDPGDLLSGGPPPDGIPPLDDPTFVPAPEVDFLEPDEGVLSLTLGGETRAYPLRVMTWHEIVNDTVGGVPVAVTYCPLCNSGVAFERQVEDQVLSFGTSGMLYANNLVMYDRQSESLWPQLTGQASIGTLTGVQLTAIPMGVVSWSDFTDVHPGALVLSQDTGFDRPYGSNPYTDYDRADGDLLFPQPEENDERLPVKQRVVGISDGGTSLAYVRESLVGAEPVPVRLGDLDLVLWHAPGQRSALDAEQVADGAEIGSVGVFEPVVDGQRLTFEAVDGGFRDHETGSTWSVLGTATEGELAGATLPAVQHDDTFWFAWVSFHPETEVREAPAGR